jgi:hypothetical protein
MADALAKGISRRQLRKCIPVTKGVRIPVGAALDLRTRCRAARLVAPVDAVFSHYTAAQLHNLPVPEELLLHMSIEQDELPRVEPRVKGLIVHRLKSVDRWEVAGGLRVATPAATFLDLAAFVDLPDLVAFGDAAGRRAGSVKEIEEVVAEGRGRRGIRLARQALKLLDIRAESAMESRLRVVLILAGLPWPAVQFEILDDGGLLLRRIDLAYPDLLIAIEYEGGHHLSSRDQWNKDIYRYEQMEADGWTVIRVTAEELLRRPEAVVARVCAAMARAVAR